MRTKCHIRLWMAICLLSFVPTGLAWTLLDNFSGGSLNNWTPFYVNATVANAANSGPRGSGDYTLKLDMPAVALKYAYAAFNTPMQRGDGATLNFAFDMKYKINATYGYSSGLQFGPISAGVFGNANGDTSIQRRFFLNGVASSGMATANAWYHYDLRITATGSTLKIYNYWSGATSPSSYANRTVLYILTSTTGIGTIPYTLLFVNNGLGRDPYDQNRDTVYVDNFYCEIPAYSNIAYNDAVPEPWTLIDNFTAGNLDNWNVFQQNATVDASGGTMNLDMPAVAGKYAYADLKNLPQRGGFEQLALAFDMENEVRNWFGWGGGIQIYQQGQWTGSRDFTDTFSGNLSNWTVEVNNATIGIVTDPLTGGPGGSVVRMDMPANDYKWVRMTLNNTPQRGANEVLKVAFDLGYTRTNWNGYEQGIGILDASGNVVIRAGHYGGATGLNFKFYLNDETSPDGLGQSSGWYHYDLEMSATQTTLRVYTWASNDPAVYAGQAPVWQKTVNTGIGAGGYSIRFANNSMTGVGWGAVERDTMYLDNVAVAARTGNAVLVAGVNGDCSGNSSCAYYFFLNGILSSGISAGTHWYHYELQMTAAQSTLKIYDRDLVTSDNPADYANVPVLYTLTSNTGIGSAGYTIRVYNNSPPEDSFAQDRDLRHIDNIYYKVSDTSISYPTGWYDYLDQSTGDLASLGANRMLIYNTDCYPAYQVQSYLDRCALIGIKVIMDLKSHIAAPDTAGIAEFVQMWNSHPAVAGWYTADEPNGHLDWWPVEHCQAAATVIRQYSNKPIYMCFSIGDVCDKQIIFYKDTYDIALYDVYPFTPGLLLFGNLDGQDGWKAGVLRAGFQAASVGKPLYNVLQGFGEAGGTENLHWRLPTYAEDRFLAYYSILAARNTGLLSWAAKWMDQSAAVASDPYPYDGPTWETNVAIPIGQEIRTLGKALAAGQIAGGVSDNSTDIVSAVYRNPETGVYYLLAVNSNSGSPTTTFTLNLPGTFASAVPLEGGSSISIVNGRFSCNFTGYGVHVFRLDL